MVVVCYPHQHHGNAGKISHAAKKDAKSDFLNLSLLITILNLMEGVLTVVQQLFFFLPKFRTIQTPKKCVAMKKEYYSLW